MQVVKKNQQASGQFNGGEILENKPLGFPNEGGALKPYSNLFYWAHAWSDNGSTIGLHPHQGFEIMSFVLEGSIEHYDTKYQEWKRLEKGDAQIIRAGNGISHSEKLNAGAHMFQIWLDPNLEETLDKKASYNDYSSNVFPVIEEEGIIRKVYVGEQAPIQMDTVGVEIVEFELSPGKRNIQLSPNKHCSFYVIAGELSVEGNNLNKDDFLIIQEVDFVEFDVKEASVIFMLANPSELTYKTYSERIKY